ncbi:MAG: hypothetical protein WBA17_15825, partial [Saprospiraceae bacterium]
HKPSNFSILLPGQLPDNHFFDCPGNGYLYEIQAVMDDVRAGRRENPLWSLADSLQLHRTLNEIGKSIGLPYV